MADFRIQNLEARARQLGQSVEDFGRQIETDINGIRNSPNIFVDGINSAVEGAANQLKGAISDAFGGLLNFGRGSTSAGGNRVGSGGINGVQPGAKGIGYTGGPLKNKLAQFASYNYIFTFGPLTNFEINYPDATYRKNGPSIVILKSGGTGNNQVKTLFEKERNITTEYFIDNVQIDTIIAPTPQTKQTNATSLSFEVMEPYSMGMFLQTLQISALQAGHKNYLEAPYLLTVEFVGWDDNGNPISIPQTKRMFPMKLALATFNTSAGGSIYQVDGIPWHEQALSDSVQTIKEDIDIKGETIGQFLQTGAESLATMLNSRQVEQEESGSVSTADQFVILFPTQRSSETEGLLGQIVEDSGATTATEFRQFTDARRQEIFETISGIQGGEIPDDFDAELSSILGLTVRRSAIGESIRDFAEEGSNMNAIGTSSIVKSYLDSGQQYFGRPAFVRDENNEGIFTRGPMQISDEGRRINFKKGTRIQDIIEELVLLSEYGRQFVTEASDENGNKTWFRIETDVYNVTDSANVDQTGKTPKVYVYRVVPYKINTSRINSPTAPTPGISNLKRQALKQYDYIYTGDNDDIINFDIQVDGAFFTAIQSDMGQLGQDQQTAGSSSLTQAPDHPLHRRNVGNNANRSSSGTSSTGQSTRSNTGLGGTVQNHPETAVARAFNDAIVNSPVDLISADLEIWGDPYYIADSGMGNYSAGEIAEAMNLTTDGTMDYQSGEVDVLINFRTPLDIGADGFMDFPGLGTKPIGAFSGLYQVIYVLNKFNGGKFTQEMKTIRRRNQEDDVTADATSQNNEVVVEGAGGASIAETPSSPAGTFNGADAESGSQGGTGGTNANGSGSANPNTDDSGADVESGAGDEAAAQRIIARRNEEQRINNILQARENGANIGF